MDSLYQIDAPGGRNDTASPNASHSPAVSRPAGRTDGPRWAWFLVALAAIPVFALALIASGLQTPHSFDTAVILMEARTFAVSGILHLHGLPVVDNPPLIDAPDYYPNWPPLAPIILSAVTASLGDGVRASQILMSGFSLAIAVMIAFVFRRAGRTGGGIAAAAAFLLTPWTMTYGFHVSMLIFGMLFGLAACLSWIVWVDRKRAGRPTALPLLAGCGFMFLALMSCWDPFFLLPGLFLASLMTGQLRQTWRGLVAYALSAALAIGVTLALYASQAPGIFAELGRKFWYRTGLGSYSAPFSPYRLVNDQADFHPGLRGYLTCAIEFLRHSVLLGPVGLTALPFALLILVRFRRDNAFRGLVHLVVPALVMWLGWTLVFAQQAMMHEFEIGAGAIAAATSVGVVWVYLAERLPGFPASGRSLPRGVGAALALLLAMGAGPAIDDRMREVTGRQAPEIALGHMIDRSVEPRALVLMTEPSMIAAFFSHRHVIRGVTDEDVVLGHPAAFRDLCVDCPLYLALHPGERERFTRMLAGRQPLAASGSWEVYRLSTLAAATTPE